MDNLSAEARSKTMAAVRSKNTTPEIRVRRMLHSLGYRFRIHCATLPGKPDLAFASRKKAVFVHGCFWHRHRNCKHATTPQIHSEYWLKKFTANTSRDRAALRSLRRLGWQATIVWECQLKQPGKVAQRLVRFLQA